MAITKNILIYGPAWIGDMVMSHSLVQALAKKYPDSKIDILSPVWSKTIARYMPEVSTVITVPFNHGELSLGARKSFGSHIGVLNYDDCYILPNSFKSALIPWFAKINERIGWKKEGRSILLTKAYKLNANSLPLMHQRYAALANNGELDENNFYPKLKVSLSDTRSIANRFNLIQEQNIVCLAPGAEYGPSKQWSEESFANLAVSLAKDGHYLLLVGSPKEVELCEKIKEYAIKSFPKAKILSLAGKTSLDDLLNLLPLSSALVCHDSGIMHIAASLGIPLVALYGSTSPHHTPPLSNKSRVIYKNLGCSPCFKRECPLKHHDCMEKIKSQEVYNIIKELL